MASLLSSIRGPLRTTSTNALQNNAFLGVSGCPNVMDTRGVAKALQVVFKKQKMKTKFPYRGILTPDSTFVTSGTRLVKQRGLAFFPGRNVGIGRDFSLFATDHGRVFITTEKFEPNWEHSYIKRFYPDHKEDPHVKHYKTFLHVIPAPMPQLFKLKDQI